MLGTIDIQLVKGKSSIGELNMDKNYYGKSSNDELNKDRLEIIRNEK